MLYRIHDRLLHGDVFIEGGNGCVHSLSMLSGSARQALLKAGAISEVRAPPLSVLWGEKGKARKLASLGIDTIGLVTMDAKDVAFAIRSSIHAPGDDERFNERVEKLSLAVSRWQSEIKDHLGITGAQIRR